MNTQQKCFDASLLHTACALTKEITFTNVFQLITLLRSLGWGNIAVFAENGEAISNDRLGYIRIDWREVYDFKRRDRSKKGEKR